MRKFRWMSLLLTLALVGAACTGDTTDTEAADTTVAAAADETTTTEAASDETTTTTEAMEEMVDLTGTTVTILGPETADDAASITAALDIFGAESGITITYTGATDAADLINTQVAGGNPPDIFVFPQPGKLADFARDGALIALPEHTETVMNEFHTDAWTIFGNVDGVAYGIPVKADLKSLVWYKPADFAAGGYTVPETWDELLALTDTIIADGGTPWCVGIESSTATGWPFTDWVEDLMLRYHGADVYDQWVAHEIPFNDDRVKQVFEEILNLWNTQDAVFAANGTIATTAFGANAEPLVNGDCFMHRQASFFSSRFPEGTPFGDPANPDAVDVFYFPSVSGDRPVLGAGTLVSAFDDRPEVWAVMEYMASADYASNRQKIQSLIKGGLSGFLSPASGQDLSLYSGLELSFLDILATAEVVRFDASDLMPQVVGSGSFWTEGTSYVNGDITVDEALASIEASWP